MVLVLTIASDTISAWTSLTIRISSERVGGVASPSDTLRNIESKCLEAQGLIREMTGQGRFRMWSAKS